MSKLLEEKSAEAKPKVQKPIPAAIQRLLDEIRYGVPTPAAYNRIHNRHNRS